ncbi:MAG: chemotaxis protein CheW, partial [Gimesia sp.]|nr:chemotaxis protein CheW [Gimesia sp.]
ISVDELLGRDDIVLKSLSDNYASVSGLSGASVMGDGSICLMLDTNEILDMSLENPGSAL